MWNKLFLRIRLLYFINHLLPFTIHRWAGVAAAYFFQMNFYLPASIFTSFSLFSFSASLCRSTCLSHRIFHAPSVWGEQVYQHNNSPHQTEKRLVCSGENSWDVWGDNSGQGLIFFKGKLKAAERGGLKWYFCTASGCILKLVGCSGRKNLISQREKQKEQERQNETERPSEGALLANGCV